MKDQMTQEQIVFSYKFNQNMNGNYYEFMRDFKTLHDKVIIPSILYFSKQRDEAVQLLGKSVEYLLNTDSGKHDEIVKEINDLLNKIKSMK